MNKEQKGTSQRHWNSSKISVSVKSASGCEGDFLLESDFLFENKKSDSSKKSTWISMPRLVPFYHLLGNKKYPVICILPVNKKSDSSKKSPSPHFTSRSTCHCKLIFYLNFNAFDWYFFTPGQYQWDCPENFHGSPGPGPWNWDGFTINNLTNRDLFSPRGPYNYLVCINIVATCNGDQIFNDMGTQITCIYTSWSIRNGPPKKCQILLTGADTEILREFFYEKTITSDIF